MSLISLALLSQAELTAALALIATERNAAEVAAAVHAIPPAELAHYEWIDTTLLLAACTSDAIAERIRACLGATPEATAALAQQQAEFCTWYRSRSEQPPTPLTIEDVIFDTRAEEGGQSEP